jgi:hypothetical protein
MGIASSTRKTSPPQALDSWRLPMSNIFRKLIVLLGAAIMCSGLSQSSIFAVTLSQVVSAFSADYMTAAPSPQPIPQAELNFKTFPISSLDYVSSSTITFPTTNIAIYYLGLTGQTVTTTTGSGKHIKTTTETSTPQFLYTTLSATKIGPAPLGSVLDVSLPLGGSITFLTEDYVKDPSLTETAIIPSTNTLTPLWPNGADFYRFYNLSSLTVDKTSLKGYWLGLYLSAIGPSNIQPIVDVPGKIATGGAYEELAFLFGPACLPKTTPEPQTYLILGSLLSGFAFIAYRRREKA